jgi:phosphomannomutase
MHAKKLFGTRGIRGSIDKKVPQELALKLELVLANQSTLVK